MKICVAPTRPVKGGIQSNINNHKRLIDFAVPIGADTIIFSGVILNGLRTGTSKRIGNYSAI